MQCKFIIEVTRDEKVYQVEVYCYDSNESLNSARQKYEQETTGEVSFKPVRAITHSFQSYRIGIVNGTGSESDEATGEGTHKLVNIIRIDETAGAAIAGHEALHAACHIFRIHYGRLDLGGLDTGDDCMECEEKLAHLHSDIVYAMTNKLIDLGVWK